MTYSDLVRLAPQGGIHIAHLARTALDAKSNVNFRVNVPTLAANPALLRVPRRRLKKWANRAFKASGVPLMRGPALAMFRARLAP